MTMKISNMNRNNIMSTLKSLIKKVLTQGCPKCGSGKIFSKYITLKKQCDHCGESFEKLKADDGPAWLTMMVIGHLIIPTMLSVEMSYDLPIWVSIIVWPLSLAVLSLLCLPFAKAFFVNMIWRNMDKDALS